MPVKERYEQLPREEPASTHCRDEISLWSLLFFHWMTGTFKTGNSRPLQQWDLLPIQEQNKTRGLTEKLKEIWNGERRKRVSCGKRPRLWRCVVKMLPAKDALTMIIFGMVDMIGSTLRTLLLGVILSNLISNNGNDNGDKTIMYVCAALIGIISMVERLATHSRSWMAEVLGARICSALKGIIYSKITLVGHRTLQEFQEGHVIDLLSNDIQRLELAPRWFFDMVFLIYFIPVVLYLYFKLFKWQAFAGMLFLLGLVPYFLFVSHLFGKLRGQTAEVSDKRIAHMNELVSGIRSVKTQACELHCAESVQELRRQEISKIRQKYFLVSTVEAIISSSPSLAVFLSVLCLVLDSWELTPENAFILLSFMKLLKFHLSVKLGNGLQIAYEAIVSLRRIEEFLLLNELNPSQEGFYNPKSSSEGDTTLNSNHHSRNTFGRKKKLFSYESKRLDGETAKIIPAVKDMELVIFPEDAEDALLVSNLTYNINEGEKNFILYDVSFVSSRNTLTVVCGRVGSGKSTLLSAIAGEVKPSSGTVHFPGTLAYVTQVPWVFSGTIKENILFSEPDDFDWYSTVVEACALKEDIELFPDKHETIVGERGVVLSGGQKARVSLARAVYSCADVYVLDDPLSAVDPKVGDQIFKKCILGVLGDKIRVLVSHDPRYLEEADEIIGLDNGRVLEKRRPQQDGPKHKGSIISDSSPDRYQAEPDPLVVQSSPDKSRGMEIPAEDRRIGNVSFQLYWDYFTSGIHPVLVVMLIALFILIQPAVIFPDVWLSYLSKRTLEQQQKMYNMVIYASATAASLVLTTIRLFLVFLVLLRSSQRLHDRMVEATLHAQLSFFDTNPTGRILNRFSRDVGCMDEQLPQTFILCIQDILFAISAVLLPVVANPWLLFVFFPTIVAFSLFGRYYLKTSRELKRHQDLHNQAFYMVFESTRWFGLRVDLLCVPFITCVGLATVGFSIDPAIAGLSLSYVMETLDSIQYAVRQFSNVESLMTSVERVITYTHLEPEPGYKTKVLPPTCWPHDGHVAFHDVTLTYYEGGPKVLRDLHFSIPGKSKIGIVGRTGAGKSSLVAAILRMPDAQGDVIVDGVRINDINLQESRRCISVLSQVPVLFSGSLRRNIDPMNQYEDDHLWAALEDVQLKSFVASLNGKLEFELLERGANLSVGERQLVCLARTLLQNNRIVILDEPTAHVDPTTETTVWNTVNTKLKNCTVITIAHRLDTIKNSDMILVMRDGGVAEFGTFDSLVDREGGILANVVQTAKR
ncbi:ATP-binding cassette sub-family C member 4-like isoform X2 [Montipora foliosa]|uniref:ATP-binding cassette sub-family C member 4-like isoform X2 n=1 Tax=Montipora foliosa TaxID=591990 RepID=UPI0035F1C81A